MCTVHTHTKCKLNSWCIGFSLAPSVNLDCEKVSTVSQVLSMVSTGLTCAVCHCLAADRHLRRRLFPADESAMAVINWDFTFGGRAGCARCQEVLGSELKLCALAEGQIGAIHISFLFTTICRVTDSSAPPGRGKVWLFKVRDVSIFPQ